MWDVAAGAVVVVDWAISTDQVYFFFSVEASVICSILTFYVALDLNRLCVGFCLLAESPPPPTTIPPPWSQRISR